MAIKRTKTTAEWGRAAKGFSSALGYAGTHLSNWAKMWMKEAAQESLNEIDKDWPEQSEGKSKNGKKTRFGGDRNHPGYTGTLHDSVASVVSDKNKIVSINYMPPRATSPQTYKGSLIFGQEYAVREAMKARYVFLPGIQAKIIVGVPYADKVNESPAHTDFIRELNTQFASSVEDYFMIKADGYKTRVFIADPKKNKK